MTTINKVPSPANSMKTCFSKQLSQEEVMEVTQEMPLPDIVLCSSLSASIMHSRRQNKRERRRHAATIQTPGLQVPDVDPDLLMEPLIKSMEKISMSPRVEMEEMETSNSAPGSEIKRRRTNSEAEAAVLSTISKTMMMKPEKKPATDENLWSQLKQAWNTIFS